jgi:hypothetical protein
LLEVLEPVRQVPPAPSALQEEQHWELRFQA